jgi:hypothetical protein
MDPVVGCNFSGSTWLSAGLYPTIGSLAVPMAGGPDLKSGAKAFGRSVVLGSTMPRNTVIPVLIIASCLLAGCAAQQGTAQKGTYGNPITDADIEAICPPEHRIAPQEEYAGGGSSDVTPQFSTPAVHGGSHLSRRWLDDALHSQS